MRGSPVPEEKQWRKSWGREVRQRMNWDGKKDFSWDIKSKEINKQTKKGTNTSNHRIGFILGYFEISLANAINTKLFTLASSRFFRQEQREVIFLAKMSQELSLGHVLKFFSEIPWTGSLQFKSLSAPLTSMILVYGPLWSTYAFHSFPNTKPSVPPNKSMTVSFTAIL